MAGVVTQVWMPMSDVPEEWKPRLRELSLGPYDGTMYRWTFQNGACWALVLFEGYALHPRNIVAWACLTCEDEPYPVVGVYVDPQTRGNGYAGQCVASLLELARGYIDDEVAAVSARFKRYPTLIRGAGYKFREWE